MNQLNTAQMIERFGKPNQVGTYLATAKIPFPLVIAWDKSVTVQRIRCHAKEVQRVERIFAKILAVYGLPEIQLLGIDLFGGCFNFRQMRGGADWSKHSWGTAIDLDPERNQLRENHTTARFARPEYTPLLDAFENEGWVSLGRLRDYDWMHFEVAA